MDIVIPNNNEEEFIEMAEKLGYNALCFIYDVGDYLNQNNKIKHNTIKIHIGILADDKSINRIKLKNKNTFVAVKSSNNDREVIEKSKADMIFYFEDSVKRDFIHQRASGLNHILCKLAKENNVTVGFSLSSILNSDNKNVVLGRMRQNIKICKKAKTKMAVASFAQKPFGMRSVHDLMSLFEILGMKKTDFLNDQNIEVVAKA